MENPNPEDEFCFCSRNENLQRKAPVGSEQQTQSAAAGKDGQPARLASGQRSQAFEVNTFKEGRTHGHALHAVPECRWWCDCHLATSAEGSVRRQTSSP